MVVISALSLLLILSWIAHLQTYLKLRALLEREQEKCDFKISHILEGIHIENEKLMRSSMKENTL